MCVCIYVWYILYVSLYVSIYTHIHSTYNIYMHIWGHKIPKTIFRHIPFIFYAHTRIHTYTTCLLGLMAQLCVGLEISVVNKLGLAPLRVDKVRVQRLASTYTMTISVCVCSVFLSECVHMCVNTWETGIVFVCCVCAVGKGACTYVTNKIIHKHRNKCR